MIKKGTAPDAVKLQVVAKRAKAAESEGSVEQDLHFPERRICHRGISIILSRKHGLITEALPHCVHVLRSPTAVP